MMLRLYDFWESGNCYKVRLLLSQLGEPFERVPIDILQWTAAMPRCRLWNNTLALVVECQ